MLNSIQKKIGLLFKDKKEKEFYLFLKQILGFPPRNEKYYELALIHKSASIIEPDGTLVNNERLEYLGDAILDAIVGDFLYHKFPKENEGFLTQMRSKIVNGENLSELAKKIGITKYIVSQVTNFKGQSKIYEDAFEAFIGAVYIDKGFTIVRKYVLNRIFKNFVDVRELQFIDTNYKSQIIEWAQKHKREVVFETNLESANSKLFVANVLIDSKTLGIGKGISKKAAEQKAANATLELIQEGNIEFEDKEENDEIDEKTDETININNENTEQNTETLQEQKTETVQEQDSDTVQEIKAVQENNTESIQDENNKNRNQGKAEDEISDHQEEEKVKPGNSSQTENNSGISSLDQQK